MMTTGKLVHVLAFAAACALPTLAEAAALKCEVDRPVGFAGLDWDSNTFHNAIARFITEKGYGCKTEAIPGSTIPLLNGMVRGDIDVTMEQWVGVLGDAWEKAKATGNVTLVGVTFDDAKQGWFVPRYLVEGKNATAPGLKSVADLPKYKEVFRDPEEPSKGRFYNGIAGWGAEAINSKKLKVYDLEKDYTNFQTDSDMVSKALVKIRATKGQHAARDVAMAWLRANTPIWTAWVPADVAKRVAAAL